MSGSGAEKDTPRQRLLRLGFLAALAGGLLAWAHLRRPRALPLELDLTSALPGQLSEVDLTVRRDGRLLVHQELPFGAEGAPAVLRAQLQARPGAAEVEVELVYRDHTTRRTRAQLALSPDQPARVSLSAAP